MTLQRYLLVQLVQAFAMAVAGLLFLVLPATLVTAVSRLGGVHVGAVLGFLPLLIVGLVPYVLPLAFLLAVVATYGRLAQDNEWTALRMAGIHPLKLLLPGALLAGVLSLGTYGVLAKLAPEWTYRQGEYKREALKDAFRSLAPGRTELAFGSFFLKAARRDGNSFVQALLQFPRASERGRDENSDFRLVADRIDLWFEGDVLYLRIIGAHVVDGPFEGGQQVLVKPLDLSKLFEPPTKDRSAAKYRTSAELHAAVASGEHAEQEHLFLFEIQRRRALATAFLLFLALGAPTGLLLRRGTQLFALAVSVGFAFIYYVLFMRLSKELAVHEAVPPAVAAWAVNALGLVIGAWLIRRALWR